MSRIENLKFSLGHFHLDISKLEISDEGVTCFVGPSGSGKTTFFNILIGLHQPQSWSWNFKGIEMAELSVSERQLGVLFQSFELFPHLSARENIEIIMQSRNAITAHDNEILIEYRDILKLNQCWNTKAEFLSGGEKQRVSLLRAIMSRPRLLLLDEPFSALDENTKKEGYELLKIVLTKSKIPAYMITHDMDEARFFTNRVITFLDGKIVNSIST